MRMGPFGYISLTIALACASVTPADASLIYTFTIDDSTGQVLGTGPYGTATLAQDGTDTVDVKVDLAPGIGFVNNGAGEPLLFNITGYSTYRSRF